jgi:hypothetical protein
MDMDNITHMEEADVTSAPGAVRRTGPKIAILVGTMPGGQGRTMCATLLTTALVRRPDPTYQIVGMDCVAQADSDTLAERMSKLELNFHQDRAELNGHEIATLNIERPGGYDRSTFFDQSVAFHEFEKLAAIMSAHNALVDFGANLINRYLNFLSIADAEAKLMGPAKVRMTIVIPVSRDQVSLHRAIDTLAIVLRLKKHSIRPVIVMNEMAGEFEGAGRAEIGEINKILELCDQGAGLVLKLTRCKAQGLQVFTSGRYSFRAGTNWGREEEIDFAALDLYRERVGLSSIFKSSPDMNELKRWVREESGKLTAIIDFAEAL